MVLLITGASHTGKTCLAQRMLNLYGYPYFSIDHLKMGIIRSGISDLEADCPEEEMTELLWPIVREMIKTAIENGQNLTVEGCYIPADWQEYFAPEYLREMKYVCLVMSKDYIRRNFDQIKKYANAIEKRKDDGWATPENLMHDNDAKLAIYKNAGLQYMHIYGTYPDNINS